MKCLVTGATGFIGSRLVEELLALGYQVNALVRSPNKLSDAVRKKIDVYQGDVLNPESIVRSMKGCSVVFHLAAFAGIWAKDHMLPYKINVTGTRNVLNAALELKINKVVYTSTAGTLSPSGNSVPVDENVPLPEVYQTDYELSKRQAEQVCRDFNNLGLNVVVVNPTRVYGPGLLSKSNSLTILIKKYLKGSWRFLPGNGKSIGNYCYIDDVVKGQILALNNGVPGENYILGGANASFKEFFTHVSRLSGKNYTLFHIPDSLLMAYSEFQLFLAEHFGREPLITPPWVRRYRQDRLVSSKKAIENLRYEITPIHHALENTIQWLQSYES
jgi:farnesol dehydrogenase